MIQALASLALVGIAPLGPARDDVGLRQRIVASLPRGTSLLDLSRLPARRAIVVTSRPGEDGLAVDASLAVVKADGSVAFSKAIGSTCGYGRPRIVRVDADGDGQPEVAIVCNTGGAHMLETVSVVKATRTGLVDLAARVGTASRWILSPGGRSKPAALTAETTTYLHTGVHDVPGPATLRIRYTLRGGRFREVETPQLRRIERLARQMRGQG